LAIEIKRANKPKHFKPMNVKQSIFTIGATLLAATVLAQSYSIDWHTIAGGGGASSGGAFSLSGTIGQEAAGKMSGGSYSLTGGFWSLIAIQSPDAPRLTITLTTTNTALVSWPSPSIGWIPQQNTDLNTTNWVVTTESINDDGTNKVLLVNPPEGNRFYRLFKP